MPNNPDNSAFDPKQLAAKYEAEREKRVRADGTHQYQKLEGKFAHFREDPNAVEIKRDPIEKDVEVAILGCGWGGILAGVELSRKGVDDICMIDKAGDFGGVWYWNRYPGVACDTEAYVYMPMLEEMDYMPKANFASGPEILAHAQAIAKRFGLYEHALFQTGIRESRWDEAQDRWIITTDRGDTIRARFFVMTSGSLQVPKLPGIPGIESFKGHSFHTSRWDFGYTGGDSFGNLTGLRGKRVAIVGTGATAIQCIPHLAEAAEHLYVIQRTPSSVDVRNEHPTDEAWYKSQEPGWQQRRIENFTQLVSMQPVEEDLVDDGWTKPAFKALQEIKPGMSPEEIGGLIQEIDYESCEAVRDRVDAVVKNPETAQKLKAWYNRVCKRPCFHDEYLQTFNRPNVTLIDTEGKGVERVTENGLVAGGEEIEVDCIIYSTGFQLGPYADVPIIPVIGTDGITLAEKWRDGATTMHGFHVHHFPNFFIISITQSPWGPNFMHMLIEQGKHVGYMIGELRERGVTRAEVTEDAEAAWVAHHVKLAPLMAAAWKDCTPGFFNNEGEMNERTDRSGPYGGGVKAFVEILENWRQAGDFAGMALEERSLQEVGAD